MRLEIRGVWQANFQHLHLRCAQAQVQVSPNLKSPAEITMVSTAQAGCDVFVIGTASLDVLHFAGQTARAAGGAGLYTAIAAARAGARAGLLAPKPTPMPELLLPVAKRLHWIGPLIAPAELPRLEIEHHGGGRATLVDASWGAEAQLTPDYLPPEICEAAFIHIAALSTAQRQLDFLHEIKRRRAVASRQQPFISVGTYARLVYGDTDRVRQLLAEADLFFMNDNEARGLFGSVDQARTRPGARLFVTLGELGALVIEGERVTPIPGRLVDELDPTGAGDTFCGATLAGLAHGDTPVQAARQAVALAAQTVAAVGPEALLGQVSR
jgi:sugar/nucleoside kinase (ribokinase family)